MVSFGSKSKQKSSSKTVFPTDFLNKAYGFFGGEPGYKPNYVGFNKPGDLDKLESDIYGSQSSKLADAYNQAVGRQREELSQSGLLNSPSQYIEGGARNVLDKGYLQNLQQAARDASLARLSTQEQEAGRETEFNVDTATKLYNAFLSKLGLAAEAGRTASGSGSSGGGFSLNLGGGSLFGGK